MGKATHRANLLAIAAVAALALAPAAAAQDGPGGISVYTNPRFQWSIAYPADWRLDVKGDRFVRISAPDKNGVCGIHSGPVKYATAKALTDHMLDYAAKRLKESRGLEQVALSREKKTLRNGVDAEEVVVKIKPNGGQARRVYAVSNGNGFLIDCASSAAGWPRNEPDFKKIIGSFTLGR